MNFETASFRFKQILKIIGWLYVAYAAIMVLELVPTLLRKLKGGYSYIEFNSSDPSFYIAEKAWVLGDKETWEYRLFDNKDGLPEWHCRLKYVNDRQDQSRHPDNSAWRPSDLYDGRIGTLERWYVDE